MYCGRRPVVNALLAVSLLVVSASAQEHPNQSEREPVTMGIGLDHFDRYSTAFDEAKYTGIWCDPGEPRWWKKRLYELAIAERTSVRESVQSAACKRFKVLEEHYCICSKCGKPWPEILAFTDEGLLADSLPTHLECSIPHPRRFVSLSFEEPRILVE
jgi:hypothetical protein